MPHPLVLGLFNDPASAARAARDLRTSGVARERVSIVARSHDEEGEVAAEAGATPGSEIEDSRTASRLGELSGHLLAAIALVMPGIGPIVADGPLAAGLGEAAGHLAGGIEQALERAGLERATAEQWAQRIEQGAVLVGVHLDGIAVLEAQRALTAAGATHVAVGSWTD